MEFDNQVKKAIDLLNKNENHFDDEEVLQLLVKNGIAYQEALEILLFLPIAFVRHWFRNMKWSDTYIDYTSEGLKLSRKFSATTSYQIIWNVTSDYFKVPPSMETFLKIGGRSAEFRAINQLLIDNPTSKIEDIQLSQTVIIR